MTFDELLEEAMKLSEEDRSTLADVLMASLGEVDEAGCLQLWGAEAYRRLEDFKRGLVDDIPAEDVFREVRESLSRGR